jgi:site-specific DNA recombinase
VRAYAEEMNRLNRDRRMQSETDRRALQKIERAIAGIMAVIEEGLYQPFMKARIDELERQRAEIAGRLAQAPPNVPDVHPNVANIYRQNVVGFTEALDDPDGGREAAQVLRSLIGAIVLTPGKNRGEVHAGQRGIVVFRTFNEGEVVMKPSGKTETRQWTIDPKDGQPRSFALLPSPD